MSLYFCSSDIHSFYDDWIVALKNKNFDINNKEHKIIICGDLFDRGTQSVECFEFIKSLKDQNRLIYIRGNHEDLLENCLKELKRGRNIGSHHVSNGTIRTISHFLNCSEYDVFCNVTTYKDLQKMDSLIEFIDSTSMDYYELGDKIFVHGWIPTTVTSETDHTACVAETWQEGDWERARWDNGMEMAHFRLTVPDKTVVCGHWHTSWGHSRYHKNGDEWGVASADFSPYRDKGIIAIDACTAYTRCVNVVVFDENGNEVN